jgi:hypothetical protein
VLDLTALRRIPRSSGLGQAADAFRIDLSSEADPSFGDPLGFVSNLLLESLERGGYRDLDAVMDQFP